MKTSSGSGAGASGPGLRMWPRRQRAPRPLWPQLLELVAIIGLLVLAYHAAFWYWEWTAPESVAVPDVLSLTQEEATKLLEASALVARIVGRKADEEVPEGSVLVSEPPPGRQVKVGRIVRLTLSAGSRWAVVPDVREMSVDRARALLRRANLTVGRELARHHPRVPIGYVVGQAPKSEQSVPRGTEIDLWVSMGPEPEINLVGGGPEGEGARSTEISYTVPPGASLQELRIVVEDRSGERVVYRKFHHPGERVDEIVSGEGPQIVVRVFLSGLLVREKTI